MIRYSLIAATVTSFVLAGTAVRADDVNVNINAPDANVRVHDDEPYGQPMLFVMGGGSNSLRDLNESFSSNFDTGYNVGGGVGVQFNRWAGLRAIYQFARARGNANDAFSPIAGSRFNRNYYGADLQFRAANSSGVIPYLLVGGGAVTIAPMNDAVIVSPTGARFSNANWTKGAAHAGLGLEYQFPNSGFGIYAEGSGWAYKWDRYGFNRTQIDTNWGGGISYRFGY